MSKKTDRIEKSINSLLLYIFLTVLLASSVIADDDVVVVQSDLWMPYNGVPESSEEGYAIDILREIFKKHGIKVQYEIVPWSRSILNVEEGSADMVVGAYKFEMPNFIFPETTIGETQMGFYSNLKYWKFNRYEDLKEVTIGVIHGYGYREWLLKDIKKRPDGYVVLYGDEAFAKLFDLLLAQKIQAVPSSSTVMDYYIMRLGLTDRIFFAGYGPSSKAEKLYYAFSPQNPYRSKELAKIIDEGMKRLRNSKRLDKILIKYGLHDWKQIP